MFHCLIRDPELRACYSMCHVTAVPGIVLRQMAVLQFRAAMCHLSLVQVSQKGKKGHSDEEGDAGLEHEDLMGFSPKQHTTLKVPLVLAWHVTHTLCACCVHAVPDRMHAVLVPPVLPEDVMRAVLMLCLIGCMLCWFVKHAVNISLSMKTRQKVSWRVMCMLSGISMPMHEHITPSNILQVVGLLLSMSLLPYAHGNPSGR